MTKTSIASKNHIIESIDSYSIVMIGAGNVSTHISRHFHSAGYRISCVYSRTEASAKRLADELGVPGTSNVEEVPDGADFYIVAVPDREVLSVARTFTHRKGTWLHTAGALPMDVFQGFFDHYGVLYPLQTLSRSRPTTDTQIPLLVEGSSPEVLDSVWRLASSVFSNPVEANSEMRLMIHIAAVFANNFSTHMIHIAEELLISQGIDPAMLAPLLEETFQKVKVHGAVEGQTGPAVRGDQETMNKHIELLKDHPEWEKLYTFISRDIMRLR